MMRLGCDACWELIALLARLEELVDDVVQLLELALEAIERAGWSEFWRSPAASFDRGTFGGTWQRRNRPSQDPARAG